MMEVRTEEERMLRGLLRRADALNTACLLIELEEWANAAAKEETLEALEEMRVEAREWFECYRRALGIPSPSSYSDDQGGVIWGSCAPQP